MGNTNTGTARRNICNGEITNTTRFNIYNGQIKLVRRNISPDATSTRDKPDRLGHLQGGSTRSSCLTSTKGMILREPLGPIISEPTYLVSRLEPQP